MSDKKEVKQSTTSALVTLVGMGALAYWFFGGGLEHQANNTLLDIQNQVAEDAVTQYGIASRNGNKMDKCVQAGLVTAAFLQAKNEA
ncbi:hypothetical protein GC177_05480 [bacterium]|nr:hypothetical protein [bacterium]